MKIVCVSDTHTYGNLLDLPDGDMIIHAGDHTFTGRFEETKAALRWFNSLPYKYKIMIAGNHDFYYDDSIKSGHEFRDWRVDKPMSKEQIIQEFAPDAIYLEDSGVEIEGLKIYGSPWQPWYYDWAFNFPGNKTRWDRYAPIEHDRETARKTWDKIPDNVDILVTHTPAFGILDRAEDSTKLGCPELKNRLSFLPKLKLHVFGHIHEAYGIEVSGDFHEVGQVIKFVNASACNLNYEPNNLNKPVVVEI